ncbi:MULTISPECIES: RNA-binding cell elongation regulator Jag/EloR [Pseudobutyrivibrio]|uniref:RNA-binding protein KhpB n=1 Tax=Pseudobutyrivibrio xylanivorans TaxID=185007 RepID=A0A1G5S3A2_PSEXY|nr:MULTISPECIES: RNA-binding cell elongation regulator Jag/EloR [Pseudobutyrivibrio]MDC7279217.1 protein jag [Butyrivibrio fibrisolvens]SCZ80638.1 spoIIIJ-associated protein [Pseudobutyrivibrio xylanivorans]
MEFKEFTGKTVDDALTNATVSLGVTSSEIKYEVVEEGSSGFLGIGSKDAIIKVVISTEEDPKQVAKEFLDGVFEAMQLEVNISMEFSEEDDTLLIDLAGPEMGVLIGKRGQTLDSLQYLTNLAVNRSSEKYTRVKIDTEDYRRRRKETLENLAKNMASKVKRTKKAVTLEAMNPYERRIIHSALQNDNNVTTHSEGEEPYRYVVITLKK